MILLTYRSLVKVASPSFDGAGMNLKLFPKKAQWFFNYLVDLLGGNFWVMARYELSVKVVQEL